MDSLRDIGDALNKSLELLGLTARAVDDYRYMVGEGLPKLCQRAVGENHPQHVARLVELARTHYRARMLCHTRPYAGVPELVGRLKARGCLLGVLSNKPHEMTARIVREFWPTGFDAIQGYTQEQMRKPDPRSLLAMIGSLGASPGRTWLVGDTPTDVETARHSGTRCIAVTWGFRTRSDLAASGAPCIVDTPEQVLTEIELALG